MSLLKGPVKWLYALLNVLFGILILLLLFAVYFTFYGTDLVIVLSVLYFFLAMAGIVPPQDFVPLVPYL